MRLPTLLLITLAGGLGVVLWAQQPDQADEPPKDRLGALESRLELVEKAVTQNSLGGASSSSASLESRLGRIEARLDQLERYALRGASSGGSSDRILEGRVRALEREVSRLRRF